jgi:hypothetical protein
MAEGQEERQGLEGEEEPAPEITGATGDYVKCCEHCKRLFGNNPQALLHCIDGCARVGGGGGGGPGGGGGGGPGGGGGGGRGGGGGGGGPMLNLST